MNAVVDSLSAYKNTVSNLQQSGLIAPAALCLFPLYVLALLKQVCLTNTHTHTELLYAPYVSVTSQKPFKLSMLSLLMNLCSLLSSSFPFLLLLSLHLTESTAHRDQHQAGRARLRHVRVQEPAAAADHAHGPP